MPSTVELRLDGPAREIIRLAREGTSLRVPVGRIGSADTLITLRRDWVDLAQRPGLVVASVSPSANSVSFEPAASRSLPASMRVQGRIREHLALATDISVSPQLIRVRGPSSRIVGLDSIPLMPFDLDRVTSSGSYTVAVDTTGLPGASVVPATAALGITVEAMVERVLEDLPIVAEVAPGGAGVVLEPRTIPVRISGARTLVMAFDPSALRVWVPAEFLEDLRPGEARPVRLFVEGVPKFVTAVPGVGQVTARRAADVQGRVAGRAPL
jgi:hypothetical protein